MTDFFQTHQEAYALYAETYAQKWHHFLRENNLDAFIHQLPSQGKILDVGCGTGRDMAYLSERGFETIGIDLSAKMVSLARKNTGCVVHQKNFLQLDFPPESFDGIWASASLLHIPKSQIEQVLQQLSAVLKLGGVLYISLKKGQGERWLPIVEFPQKQRFFAFYEAQELQELLEKNGFQRVTWLSQNDPEWLACISHKCKIRTD